MSEEDYGVCDADPADLEDQEAWDREEIRTFAAMAMRGLLANPHVCTMGSIVCGLEDVVHIAVGTAYQLVAKLDEEERKHA